MKSLIMLKVIGQHLKIKELNLKMEISAAYLLE